MKTKTALILGAAAFYFFGSSIAKRAKSAAEGLGQEANDDMQSPHAGTDEHTSENTMPDADGQEQRKTQWSQSQGNGGEWIEGNAMKAPMPKRSAKVAAGNN